MDAVYLHPVMSGRSSWRLGPVLVLAALFGGSTRAEPAPVPDDATLEASGAVIGRIVVVAGDVFDTDDPTENKWPFRLANKVHPVTHDRVILQQLSFKPGDAYSRRVLDESERILRKSGYLYDAWIRPVRFENNTVDVEVRTRDVWTLKAGFGFGRSGGVNKTHVGLEDSNFLGFGKSLELRRSSNVDRTETLWRYRDTTLFGTHARLDAAYSDNSDGQLQRLTLERPFYSFDTRWAAGFEGIVDERIDPIYALGTITDRLGHRKVSYGAYAGLGSRTEKGYARRFSAGLQYRQDTYSAPLGFDPPSFLPDDRTLAYPWIGFDLVEDGYVKTRDLDKLGRTEDFNLGMQLHARLGWSAPAFGATVNAAIVELSYGGGFHPGPAQTILLDASVDGRVGSSGAENALAAFEIRYDRRDGRGNVFHLGFRTDASRDLDPEKQIVLGGENGLRGYPLRYAVGTASWLFTAEERFYWDREVFKLFRLGAAVFFDAGQVRGLASTPGGDLDLLRDLGVGLRIGQSRSSHAAMIHVDLAAPLDGRAGIRGLQFLVTTGETF